MQEGAGGGTFPAPSSARFARRLDPCVHGEGRATCSQQHRVFDPGRWTLDFAVPSPSSGSVCPRHSGSGGSGRRKGCQAGAGPGPGGLRTGQHVEAELKGWLARS